MRKPPIGKSPATWQIPDDTKRPDTSLRSIHFFLLQIWFTAPPWNKKNDFTSFILGFYFLPERKASSLLIL